MLSILSNAFRQVSLSQMADLSSDLGPSFNSSADFSDISLSNIFSVEASGPSVSQQREKTAFQKMGVGHTHSVDNTQKAPGVQASVTGASVKQGVQNSVQNVENVNKALGNAQADAGAFKGKALNAVGAVAEKAGLSPSLAKESVAPKAQSTMVGFTVGAVVQGSLGGALQIAESALSFRNSRRKYTPGVQAELVQRAATQMNAQANTGSGAVTDMGMVEEAAPAPSGPQMDEKGVQDLINEDHPEIDALEEQKFALEGELDNRRLVEDNLEYTPGRVWNELAIGAEVNFQMSGLQINSPTLISNPQLQEALLGRPEDSTFDARVVSKQFALGA